MKSYWRFQSTFAVGVDILSQQNDFFRSPLHQSADLGVDFFGLAGFFAATGERHHAETAKLVASLDDVDERAGKGSRLMLVGNLGNGVVFLIVKVSPYKRFLCFQNPVHRLRNALYMIRTQNKIKEWDAL